MKKFIGWLTVIFCSLFLMLFLACFLVILYSRLENPENATPIAMTTEFFVSIFFSLLCITLLIVGLKNGLKKIRKNKIVCIDYTDVLDINLTGKISFKDYRNLVLEESFKRVYIIFFSLLVWLVFFYFYFLIFKGIVSEQGTFFIIFLILTGIILPMVVIRRTKKVYQTNRIFQEQLNYKLTNDTIQTTGETFNSVQKWTGFYKIKETKVFILLYTGEGTAVLLDKKMFTTEELSNFKQFLCSLNLKQ